MKGWKGTAWVLLAGTMVLVAACSRTPQSIDPLSPSPAGSGPGSGPSLYAASPGDGPTPGQGTESPRPGPSPNTVPIPVRPAVGVESKGSASIGGEGWTMNLDFDTVVDYPYYSGLGQEASVVWQDPYGNTMAIGGNVYLGTKRSGGGALVLAINMNTDPRVSITSGDGSCRITISRADPRAIEGSFKCPEAAGGGRKTFDVNGTFLARFPK